jgi:coenzyme F420-0:L-glutamate ligase / coenzyme F420-1:gamma-L-glutamate ligase
MIEILPVRGLPALASGDDLAGMIRAAVAVRDGDVVVVAQKAVSKVEGRVVELADVTPSPAAVTIAADNEDPRFVELVLRESSAIIRRRGAFLICRTHHGFVCASAGVDRSNSGGVGRAVLLPKDPDRSAATLRRGLGGGVAVIISDSFGRPFRQAITGVAVGCAGLDPIDSFIGRADDDGRPFAGTAVHVADELAAAAGLVLSAAGGVPAAVIRGVAWRAGDRGAADTVMPPDRDLFGG